MLTDILPSLLTRRGNPFPLLASKALRNACPFSTVYPEQNGPEQATPAPSPDFKIEFSALGKSLLPCLKYVNQPVFSYCQPTGFLPGAPVADYRSQNQLLLNSKKTILPGNASLPVQTEPKKYQYLRATLADKFGEIVLKAHNIRPGQDQ